MAFFDRGLNVLTRGSGAMIDEYLSKGFADIDLQKDGAVYKDCLRFLDSLPYYRRCKERSYELLRLAPGLSVLDVGCGIGDDVFRMAERVVPGGRVVGIDASSRMIEEARLRLPASVNVAFREGDARALPFRDSSFSRCRIDRTLQHIEGADMVLREMVRVLKPGGLLLAYDNDWGTFSINGTDEETTRIIERYWCDSFTNRWIGRYLKGYLLAAGLEEIRVYPSVSLIDDFDTADRIYNVRLSVDLAVEAGLLTQHRAEQWLLNLERLTAAGGFYCALAAYTVTGRKPDQPCQRS
jgi:ubiquinone/menaquinone biosynthesis C-methylase UbiE